MHRQNEHVVRAFYAATIPGHREALWAIQAPGVVYDLPSGMPAGSGHFVGLLDVTERFLTSFYDAFDVRFVPDELLCDGDEVVVLGRIVGSTRRGSVPVEVPFAHVWTVQHGRLQRLRGFTDTAVLAEALERARSTARADATERPSTEDGAPAAERRR